MARFSLVLCLVVAITGLLGISAGSVVAKNYACVSGSCQLQASDNNSSTLSHSACRLSCEHGNLWPYPRGHIEFGNDVIVVNENGISCGAGNNAQLQSMCINFGQSLQYLYKQGNGQNRGALVDISFEIADQGVTVASIDNDESYTISITPETNKQRVVISASNVFGARHALETLSQLFAYDSNSKSLLMLSSAKISDKPMFKYRGVMIDVARNFISVDKIKETIRAMGYNKMNVLHMHLSDTASFPVEIENQPEMTAYGAYSDDKIYNKETISELQEFANNYGVMILPEIDAPAHVAAGWTWGKSKGLGDLVLCTDHTGQGGDQWTSDALEPPSGQFNLVNDNAYTVLGHVYDSVISSLGQSGYFHFGGDEVIVGSDESWAACYNSSTLGKPVLDYIASQGMDRGDPETFYSLWDAFVGRASRLIQESFNKRNNQKSSKKIHVWGGGGGKSDVTYNMITRPDVTSVLPVDRYTIQVWDGSQGSITKRLVKQGYDVVLSNTDYVYLDCGNAGPFSPGGYWCQPYHEWYHIHDYIKDVQSLWKLSDKELEHIIGSETLAWSEMIDDTNIAQKLWPRSAALAEALWSHDSVSNWYESDPRMMQWRQLLVKRDIPAEALRPLWCAQRQAYACTMTEGTPGTDKKTYGKQ